MKKEIQNAMALYGHKDHKMDTGFTNSHHTSSPFLGFNRRTGTEKGKISPSFRFA